MAKASGAKGEQSRLEIIRAVQTPLGFFVLVVLVIETFLGVIAVLAEFHRTLIISGMLVIILSLIAVVAFLAYARPEALAGTAMTRADAEALAGRFSPPVSRLNESPPTPSTFDAGTYQRKFDQAQQTFREITPTQKILLDQRLRRTRLQVVNADITSSRAQVIVSSDDNYLQAKGGVAKAILEKAGPLAAEELRHYRNHQRRQGDIAITTAGDFNARAIIHPAVIDLDDNSYPDHAVIELIVLRCLRVAAALGARSIAFPVLGGGTAKTEVFTAWDSIQAILSEIIESIVDPERLDQFSFDFIAVYVFDQRDIAGDLRDLVRRATEGRIQGDERPET